MSPTTELYKDIKSQSCMEPMVLPVEDATSRQTAGKEKEESTSENVSENFHTTVTAGDTEDTKRRRLRTSFTQDQIEELEDIFQVTHYPNIQMRDTLSLKTGVPECKIQIWFQNRRAKWRKYEKLGNFGGLEAMTEVDIIPAPRGSLHDPDQTPSTIREDTGRYEVGRTLPIGHFLTSSFSTLPHRELCNVRCSEKNVTPTTSFHAAHGLRRSTSIATLRKRAQEHEALQYMF